MANAFFYLLDKKAKTSTHIILSYSCSDGYAACYLPFKITPKNWDNAKKRVKNVIEVVNRNEINNYLSDLELHVNIETQKLILQKKPICKADIKQIVNDFTKPVDTAPYLQEFIKNFIADCYSGKILFEGRRLNPNTMKGYHVVYSGIVNFEKIYGKKRLDQVNQQYYDDYSNYLTKKGYAINTVGKHQKKLKVFLKEARRQGLHHDTFIIDAKAFSADTKSIYLNEAELQALHFYDFSQEPRLDRVRDMALLGCWTGLRISDWQKARPENIRVTEAGHKFLQILQTKTSTEVFTPLLPIVESILAKYPDGLPIISDQKFNEYIKEVCQIVGINEIINKHTIVAGQPKETSFEKWRLVTSHTCRRSFATNMKRRKYDSRMIMAAMGHKSESSFNKYLKLTGEDYINMFFE